MVTVFLLQLRLCDENLLSVVVRFQLLCALLQLLQCVILVKSVTLRFWNFRSHFIPVQIFQIDFPLVFICWGQNEHMIQDPIS